MVKIYSVYKITNNINGKKYIGFTSKTPAIKRFLQHIKISEYGGGFALHNSIRKYGKDNFSFEIISETESVEIAKENERINIVENNSKFPFGYNLTNGGDGVCGRILTDEQRKKLSLSHIGQKPNKTSFKSGHIPWNKGISYDRMRGENNPQIKNRKKYRIVYSDGREEIIIGFKKFCRDNNYNAGCLRHILNGKYNRHKDIVGIYHHGL